MDRSRKRVANSQLVYRIIDRSMLCRKMQPLYGRSSHYDPINTTRFRSACCEVHVYYCGGHINRLSCCLFPAWTCQGDLMPRRLLIGLRLQHAIDEHNGQQSALFIHALILYARAQIREQYCLSAYFEEILSRHPAEHWNNYKHYHPIWK